MINLLKIKIGMFFSITSIVLLSISNNSSANTIPSEKTKKGQPNILLVVADDLGMLDIGAFGSEIRTPVIDSIANSGIKMMDFHTSATCSPTRAMLLSGVNSHKAGLGNMIEHISPNQRNQKGYEGYLSHNVVSVASLLKDAGYQ